ncbi:hypothetical protein [Methylocystis rosea]|uniref:hypothetical protein n=1 Tax=Methylocystis rosea TaxID=173366 RepID=UPI0013DD9B0A|nr:hypothetical protein [Methylocystis rosea]
MSFNFSLTRFVGLVVVQVGVDKFRLSGGKAGDVVGKSLDKGVELDALAKAADEERKSLIARAKAGENVSAREPLSDARAVKAAIVSVWTLKARDARAALGRLSGVDVQRRLPRPALGAH